MDRHVQPTLGQVKAAYGRLVSAIAPRGTVRTNQEAGRDLITLGVGFWCVTIATQDFGWNIFDHALGAILIAYCIVRYIEFD
jgi:hypothetical protein